MSWASVHLADNDDIRPADRAIPGYIRLHLGADVELMAPRETAQRLHAVLGDLLAQEQPDA